mgnify:CR=1 FL=1
MKKLFDLQIKKAKAGDKPYTLADGNGLCVLVKPKGKYWRYWVLIQVNSGENKKLKKTQRLNRMYETSQLMGKCLKGSQKPKTKNL